MSSSPPLTPRSDAPAAVARRCANGDLAAVKAEYGRETVEEARKLVASLPGAPLLGDWLDHHDATGDLSTCRKATFGPDETDDAGVNLEPVLRSVYRLRPSNHDVRKVEVLAVAPRRDLETHALAAGRLDDVD
jgi:hypothetical protein